MRVRRLPRRRAFMGGSEAPRRAPWTPPRAPWMLPLGMHRRRVCPWTRPPDPWTRPDPADTPADASRAVNLTRPARRVLPTPSLWGGARSPIVGCPSPALPPLFLLLGTLPPPVGTLPLPVGHLPPSSAPARARGPVSPAGPPRVGRGWAPSTGTLALSSPVYFQVVDWLPLGTPPLGTLAPPSVLSSPLGTLAPPIGVLSLPAVRRAAGFLPAGGRGWARKAAA